MRTTVGGGANFFSDSGDDSEAFDIDDALAQWTQLDPDDGDDDSGLLGGTFGESPLLFGNGHAVTPLGSSHSGNGHSNGHANSSIANNASSKKRAAALTPDPLEFSEAEDDPLPTIPPHGQKSNLSHVTNAPPAKKVAVASNNKAETKPVAVPVPATASPSHHANGNGSAHAPTDALPKMDEGAALPVKKERPPPIDRSPKPAAATTTTAAAVAATGGLSARPPAPKPRDPTPRPPPGSTARPPPAPLDISQSEGIELLSEAEAALASALRLQPLVFIQIKTTILNECRKNNGIRRRQARELIKIDVNKTSRIWDLMKDNGEVWIQGERP